MPTVSILADNGALSGSAGLKTSGGNDGVLQLQTTTAGGTPTTAISISNTQVVTYTNQPTYTGGTANGVLYLNGSKAVTSGTALQFDGTNISFGTVGAKINFATTGSATQNYVGLASDGYSMEISTLRGASQPIAYKLDYASGHVWSSAGTQRMLLDTSGNLGLGVTPSAWQSGRKAFQVGYSSMNSYSNSQIQLGANFYYDGTNNKYITTDYATAYQQINGYHAWYTAPSGTAGNAITFTQAMTLDASGNWMVGQTSATGKASVTGTGTGNVGVLALTVTDSSSTFIWASQAFAANIPSGSNLIHIIGQSGSTKNSGYIGYKWASNGSNSNLLTFGHFSSDNLMNLDASGNLLVGTTTKTAASISSTGTIQVNSEFISRGPSAGVFWENRAGGVTSGSNWYGFYAPNSTQTYLWNGSANVASINNSSGAYTALSDVNKKKDFEASEIGLSAVLRLQPKLFRMLDDAPDAPKQLGFIAQDVQTVIPQAYVEQHAVDAGGNEATYIGLNDRPIIAVLTKAIQELKAEVDALKGQA